MPTPRSTAPPGPVTVLLRQAAAAQLPPEALVERLMPVVYDELREIARAQRRRAGADAFQTTALVHEAYLRLAGQEMVPERAYVFAAAAQAMRNVLVDHARRRTAVKRGGGARPVSLDAAGGVAAPGDLDAQASRVLDVDAALRRLETLSPRAARLAECRFFAGLSAEEAAAALGISESTAKREWRRARAWLHRALADDAPEASGEGAAGHNGETLEPLTRGGPADARIAEVPAPTLPPDVR